MKCPKCGYIGFETTDRCRHCGYEFSLHVDGVPPAPDLTLRARGDETDRIPAWLQDAVDGGLGHRAEPSALPHRSGMDGLTTYQPEALPLFEQPLRQEDQPLITIAPPPRSPLAVRRTPVPRSRPTPRPSTPPTPREPRLEFAERATLDRENNRRRHGEGDSALLDSRVDRRVLAALLDAAVLLTIDAIVVYLTLRMASLPTQAWRQLPPVPVLVFLGMVKLAYYSVFTAYGGQTLGKMAAGLRVVSELDGAVKPQRAVGRSLLWGASVATLGVPLVPWLFGRDGRALHDRLARTRVVSQ